MRKNTTILLILLLVTGLLIVYASTKAPSGDSSSKRNAVSQSKRNDSIRISETVADKSTCAVIAERFVKDETVNRLETEFHGRTIHEKIDWDTAKLLGRFSTKNDFGVKKEYVYSIQIKFNGGKWEDMKNWRKVNLEIEPYKGH